MTFKVWASSANSPLIVCDDGSAGVTDASMGDPDWDVGINFPSLYNLTTKLEGLGKKIDRLAICAHGLPGYVDVDSVFPPNSSLTQSSSSTDETLWQQRLSQCLSVASFPNYRQTLQRIDACMSGDSTVLFMSCIMGSGQMGSELLIKLSKEVWTQSAVIGFIRIGSKVSRINMGRCDFPGMKFGLDNDSASSSAAQQAQRVQALAKEPWADGTSPVAKIAKGGVLRKNPEEVDYFKTMIGIWAFEIGEWKGVIEFEPATMSGIGPVYWANNRSDKRHYGHWQANGGKSLGWYFNDDPQGWRRIFQTELTGASCAGTAKINGVPHGYFRIVNNRL